MGTKLHCDGVTCFLKSEAKRGVDFTPTILRLMDLEAVFVHLDDARKPRVCVNFPKLVFKSAFLRVYDR